MQDGIVVIPAAAGWFVQARAPMPSLGISEGEHMGQIVAWELRYVDGELAGSQPLVAEAGCALGMGWGGPQPLTEEECDSARTAYREPST